MAFFGVRMGYIGNVGSRDALDTNNTLSLRLVLALWLIIMHWLEMR
jgi:hypothetical protein